MNPTDAGLLRRRWLARLPVGAISVGGVVDLTVDQPASLRSFHVLFEISLRVLAIGAVAYRWLGWHDAGRSLDRMHTEFEAGGAERDPPGEERTHCVAARGGGLPEVGLSEWAECSAFFLDDLRLPANDCDALGEGGGPTVTEGNPTRE